MTYRPLVNRFLEKYTALHGKRTPGITERALRALRNYDWPGNIRELENIIERGVIITANDTHIDLPNLFPELSVEPAATAQTQTSTLADSPSPQNSGLLFDRMLDQILEQNIPLGTVEKQTPRQSRRAGQRQPRFRRKNAGFNQTPDGLSVKKIQYTLEPVKTN